MAAYKMARANDWNSDAKGKQQGKASEIDDARHGLDFAVRGHDQEPFNISFIVL